MANKLLLLSDVDALGRIGDLVSVKPGYARNYLLPKGLAIIASKHALRMQAKLQEERKIKAAEDRQEAEAIAAKFEGFVLETTVKVDNEGHMYGSVTVADVLQLLNEQASIALEKRALAIKHPFKEVGVHTVHVKLNEGVTASFQLKIVPEETQGSLLAKKE